MTEYTIDLKGVRGPADLHHRIAEALQAPDYYGYNLDALYDLLTEMAGPAEIRFTGLVDARQIMPGTIGTLQQLCKDVSEENEGIQMRMEENHDQGR